MENKIQDIFLPYELAKELKELGFNEQCLGYYKSTLGIEDEKLIINLTVKDFYQLISIPEEFYILAPTWEQAFKFFRDKYKLMHIINPYDFTAEIDYLDQRIVDKEFGDFIPHDHLYDEEGEEKKHSSYEEAREECLKQMIKIVKDGK